jgi:NhaP-type Na+/H+ or K+/H+ antiporter
MHALFPWLVVGFIAGLVVGSWFYVPIWSAAIPFCILILTCCILVRGRQEPLRHVLLLLLFASLGAVHAQRIISPDIPSNHLIYQVSAERADIEGVIVQSPEIREDRTRIVLRVLRRYDGRLFRSTTGLALITVGEGGERFQYGSRLFGG